MNRFYDMAKFFLILFSLLLTFSIGVFFFDQVLTPTNTTLTNSDAQTYPEADSDSKKIVVQSNRTEPSAIKLFYKNKIRPLVKKILSDEEVEVKTNTEITKQDSETSDADDAKSDEALTFAEMLAKEEASRNKAKPSDKTAEKKTTVVKTKKDSTKSPTVTGTQKPKTTEVVKKSNPSSTAQAAKSTATRYATPEGWCIQIAAFRAAADAEKVAEDLTKSRYPNFIYQTEINGNTWYRVNIGPFESPGAAATFKQSRGIGQKFKGAFVKKL